MNKLEKKLKQNKLHRKARVRAKIFGTSQRLRLSVFKSNKSIYLQLIDDELGKTIISVNLKEVKEKGDKTKISAAAGKLLAQKAIKHGIKQAVFDRGGNKYHGRVKAAAEAAREGGLRI
ncbi:50S ribosomal protein L18 [Candidatus Falkowbacteria bacterium CG10_big_fil_rev_8_21_14_0_10_43_10]|uniref:Large ribosomal subunit protein uL18 n=1 Tax=Candidatus Falkowbacteria bacterium CG10_big_fil_rev_8_21_14_0_10_43_10 TaxID=1974567 RepID=A0A2H0V2Q6_9BACT|nr:MAG: 50S ribosomal protein L18 [Candidatus Falkowbacteria bacterium CG10_big_fil_rev_8_21_14_0_10_43_10]